MEKMARNVTMEDTIQEDRVKRLKYVSLDCLVDSMLAGPDMARGVRSSSGGVPRGVPRSDQVQAENKRADKDSDPTKGSKEKKAFFFQAEDGIRDYKVTGVQTCALPI